MNHRSHLSVTIISSWMSLVVTSVCQLVAIPVALAALGKAEFALYAVITQMLMAVMLAEFGVRSACARLLIGARAEGPEAYDRMWMAAVCVFVVQAVVMFSIVLVLAPFLGDLFHLEPGQRRLARAIFLTVGAINSVGYMLGVFSTALFAGQQLAKTNLIAALSAVVQLGVFVTAIRNGAGLWAYAAGIFAAQITTQSLVVALTRRYGLVGKFDVSLFEWDKVREVFQLGMDVFVAAVFSMVMGSSLLLFSGHLLTMEQTAVLAVNLKLVSLLTQLLQRIPGSAGPMLMKLVSEGRSDQFRRWWTLVTKTTLSVGLLGAGMFVLWNRWIVSWWTSPEMVMPLGAVILLSLVPFRYLVHYQFVNSLTIFKEIRKVKWMLVWEIILYSGLAYVLAKKFGMVGLLSANLLSILGGALFKGIRWFSVYSGIAFRNLLMLLARLCIPLSLAFVVVLWAGGFWLGNGLAGIAGLSGVWACAFLVIGFLFILDDYERCEARGMIVTFRKKFA